MNIKYIVLSLILIISISAVSAFSMTTLRTDIWGDTIASDFGYSAFTITNYNSSGFSTPLISCSGSSCSDVGYNVTGGILPPDNSTLSLSFAGRRTRYFNDGISKAYFYMYGNPSWCYFNNILNGWVCENHGATQTFEGADFLQYITGVPAYNIGIQNAGSNYYFTYDTLTQTFTYSAIQLIGTACHNINPNPSTIFRTIGGTNQNGILSQNFTKTYVIGTYPTGYGRFYCDIHSDSNSAFGIWSGDATHSATMYKFTNMNNISEYTNYNTFSSTCSNILSLPLLNIYSADCKNDNDCLAVGSYNNGVNALMFSFNKTGCTFLDVRHTSIENNTLLGVAYNSYDNIYGVVGKNTYFTTGNTTVAGLGVTQNVTQQNYSNITFLQNATLLGESLCLPNDNYQQIPIYTPKYCGNTEPKVINGVTWCTASATNVNRWLNALNIYGVQPQGTPLFPCYDGVTFDNTTKTYICNGDYVTELLNNPQWSNNICTQPLIVQSSSSSLLYDAYCDIDNIHYCNLGCLNTINTSNNKLTGICYQQSSNVCTDSCNYNGTNVNLNGYSQCVNDSYVGVCTLQPNGCLARVDYRSSSCGNTSGINTGTDWDAVARSCLQNPSQAICTSANFCKAMPTFTTCLAKQTESQASIDNRNLWIAIIFIMLSVIISAVFLINAGVGSGIVSSFVGLITVLEVIGFTIAGYIPAWVTTIAGLIAGAILYFAIRSMLIGSHNDG